MGSEQHGDLQYYTIAGTAVQKQGVVILSTDFLDSNNSFSLVGKREAAT